MNGVSVQLTTQNTIVGTGGATGAGTIYTGPGDKKYYVKVMTDINKKDNPSRTTTIKRIFAIEVGILQHLNKNITDSQYFPKYFGSIYDERNKLWVIATEITPHTEYIDLSAYIVKYKKENRDFTSDMFTNIAKQLCEGLSLMHKAGVYHRDIKLENVVIDTNTGNIMYIDFNGCYCKAVYKSFTQIFDDDDKSIDKLTTDGTAGYFHPEIVIIAKHSRLTEFGKIVNLPKYDYWALAHLLYSLKNNRENAFEKLYGIEHNKGNELNQESYYADMELINNYTITPNRLYNEERFKNTYPSVYENIQKLDAELTAAKCWTFTDLMKASNVKTGKPLEWRPNTFTGKFTQLLKQIF